MRSIQSWLDEYGTSHRNATNKSIHWICVPAIFFSIVGLLYSIPLPFHLGGLQVTVAHIALVLVLLYYFRLSPSLSMGMLVFVLLCLWAWRVLDSLGATPWILSLIIFVVAWIGQFIGHKIEGAKPSFFKDLQFLLIGPAWLLSFIYRKAGIPF
ncbi:Uncharacterized membrane protein YGL010W [Chitinophaga jiangningensis]|uniref:Uncharacterized membrane protein YGL010W n=1 Tax=Chitinophaga jiangningensis TaxID=1419482 RepID=A0A1M7M1G3_9BACT|nr:Mpo1-like protein [Chitinophaga jiangningensis]SHM84414.1 Uncharacterized membrane protein YGL010W [Chitinophaga jiangningensis]